MAMSVVQNPGGKTVAKKTTAKKTTKKKTTKKNPPAKTTKKKTTASKPKANPPPKSTPKKPKKNTPPPTIDFSKVAMATGAALIITSVAYGLPTFASVKKAGAEKAFGPDFLRTKPLLAAAGLTGIFGALAALVLSRKKKNRMLANTVIGATGGMLAVPIVMWALNKWKTKLLVDGNYHIAPLPATQEAAGLLGAGMEAGLLAATYPESNMFLHDDYRLALGNTGADFFVEESGANLYSDDVGEAGTNYFVDESGQEMMETDVFEDESGFEFYLDEDNEPVYLDQSNEFDGAGDSGECETYGAESGDTYGADWQ